MCLWVTQVRTKPIHTSRAMGMKSNRPVQELTLAGSQLLDTLIKINLKAVFSFKHAT